MTIYIITDILFILFGFLKTPSWIIGTILLILWIIYVAIVWVSGHLNKTTMTDAPKEDDYEYPAYESKMVESSSNKLSVGIDSGIDTNFLSGHQGSKSARINTAKSSFMAEHEVI